MRMFAQGEKTEDAPAAEGKTASVDPVPPQKVERPNRPQQSTVPSLISAGLTVKGNLESAGEIQIDGEVEGDVRGKTVVIGKDATVKGGIFADSVTVSGTLEGKIEAMTVNVQNTARLIGDIIHEKLQIDSGAYLDGRCSPHLNTVGPRSQASQASSMPKAASAKEPREPAKSQGTATPA